MKIIDLNLPGNKVEAEEMMTEMVSGNKDYCYLPLLKKDGKHMPAFTKVWFGNWNGEECMFGNSKDLTIQEAALERFTKVFDSNPSLMALSNSADGKFIEVNKSFLKVLGFNKEEVIGKTTADLRISPNLDEQKRAHDMLLSNGSIHNFEMEVRKKSGEIMHGLFSGEIIYLQETAIFLTIMNDITDLKQAQNESLHDFLTGLYNRRFYEEELRRLDAERNLPLSLIVGDVNKLKEINDNFGHFAGDELLKIVSSALKRFCRADDIIARIGGDEFVIILPKTSEDKAKDIITQINKLLSSEKICNQNVSISLGCKSKRYMEENINEVFEVAEENMYKEKQKKV